MVDVENVAGGEVAVERAAREPARGAAGGKAPRRGRWRLVLRLAVALCLVASMAAIWLLTEQDSADSGALSASVEATLGQNAASSADDGASASGDAEASGEAAATDESATGDGGDAGTGEPAGSSGSPQAETSETPSADTSETGGVADEAASLWASVREAAFAFADWLVVLFGVRRMAHVAEFFAMGLFAAMLAVLWPVKKGFRRVAMGLAVALCLAWSVLDQVHKMFVPGRHFDGVDLAFDAAGYLVAAALVVLAWACARRLGSASGARPASYSR